MSKWKEDPSKEIVARWLFPRPRMSISSLTVQQVVRNLKRYEEGKYTEPPPDDVLKILCKEYRVEYSMIYPLLFGEERTGPLDIGLNQFIGLDEINKSDSQHCDYSFPTSRLSGCEAICVHVRLRAEGRSEIHNHMGDEFIFVMSGKVRVVLDELGYDTRALVAGEYVHFYGEHRHQVFNLGLRSAELFIIRLHPYSGGYRNYVANRIKELKKQLHEPDLDLAQKLDQVHKILEGDVLPWVSDLETSLYQSELQNPQGLTGLIREYIEHGRASLSQLIKKGKNIPNLPSPAVIRKIVNGDVVSSIGRPELKALAKLFKAPPFIFYHYLYPRRHNFVSITKQDYDLISPAEFDGEDALFYAPIRSLAGSDISVGRVVLEPGVETEKNQHPGSEFVLPLLGETEINVLPNPSLTVSTEKRNFAHFDSGHSHQLINRSPEKSEVLVIRFYQFKSVDNMLDSD